MRTQQTEMTAQEVLDLSVALQDFVEWHIMFRSRHAGALTATQRQEAELFEGRILDVASTLNAQSLLAKLAMLDDQLVVLRECTAGLKDAVQNINDVRKGISLLGKVFGLAVEIPLAISTGNVSAMIGAAGKVLDLTGQA